MKCLHNAACLNLFLFKWCFYKAIVLLEYENTQILASCLTEHVKIKDVTTFDVFFLALWVLFCFCLTRRYAMLPLLEESNQQKGFSCS